MKKPSSWNVSAIKCFVDVVSRFSCQPTELRFTRKTRFWNRDLEKTQKVLSLPESPMHSQNRTEAGWPHRYKAATAFRNSGKYWDRNEIGKLQSSNISLSFLGIFGRYDNCKNFPVPKEVLVGDQYLSKAWGKTFWAAIKELCIRASTESEHSITLRCTRKLLVAWKQKTSLNLPTSPLEQSLR